MFLYFFFLFFVFFFLFFRRLFFFGPVLFWVSFLGRHVAAIFLSLGGPQKMCENKIIINRAILFVCSVFINTFTTQHILLLERSVIPRRREKERESEKKTHGRNARKRRDRRDRRERERESVVPEK